MPKTIALGLTHPGNVRNRNEDAFFILDTVVPGLPAGSQSHAARSDSPVQFFAVADGMGGRGIGDMAASAALHALEVARRQIRHPARFDFEIFVRDFLKQASQTVLDALQKNRGLYAGTALTLLCLTDDSAYVLSMGNCRCYRLRDGKLGRLTEDDVLADVQPRRLSRYLGQLPEEQPSEPPQVARFTLMKEDVFLLASDGFTDAAGEAAIAARLNAPIAFAMQPETLLASALAGEARDNLTLLLLRVLDPASTSAAPGPTIRPARHLRMSDHLFTSRIFRAFLILMACILTGFVAGWLLLTILI